MIHDWRGKPDVQVYNKFGFSQNCNHIYRQLIDMQNWKLFLISPKKKYYLFREFIGNTLWVQLCLQCYTFQKPCNNMLAMEYEQKNCEISKYPKHCSFVKKTVILLKTCNLVLDIFCRNLTLKELCELGEAKVGCADDFLGFSTSGICRNWLNGKDLDRHGFIGITS